MSSLLSELLFYKYLLDYICPTPKREAGEHCMVLFPYKYGLPEYFGPNLIMGKKTIDPNFLQCMLGKYGIVDDNRKLLRIIKDLFMGKIYSDFIPVPPSERLLIKDYGGTIYVEAEGCNVYTVHYLLFTEEYDVRKEVAVINFNRCIPLFRILIDSRYRPDAICLYFHVDEEQDIILDYQGGRAYPLEERNMGKRKRKNKSRLKVVELYRAYILEVKSSDPMVSRSYTPNQRRFLKMFNELDHSIKDLYKYMVVYIPTMEVIDRLWYEIYVNE